MNLNTKLIITIGTVLSLVFVGATLKNYYAEKYDAEANLLEQAERIRHLLIRASAYEKLNLERRWIL